MNENLNLVEIFKNVPIGTELWSYACGTCYFQQIVKYTDYPIICKTVNKDGKVIIIGFTKDGRIDISYDNGKCVLFPSEQNHDWSTFKIPNPHKHFEPYQKVLVKELVGRHCEKAVWLATEYSHYDEDLKQHYCAHAYGYDDDQIIPYDGNEDMIGKTTEI